MKKIKLLLPVFLALILSIIVCVMVSKAYTYKTYDKDLSKYNDKIKELQYNISIYTKDSSFDKMKEDLSYVFEDGEEVVALETDVIQNMKYDEITSVEMLDSEESKPLLESQKKLRTKVEKGDSVNIFSSAWSLDRKSKLVFLSSFYNGKNKVPVVWEVFNEDGSLFGLMKANYNLDTRLYSDIKFFASKFDVSFYGDSISNDNSSKDNGKEENKVKDEKSDDYDPDDFSDFEPPGGFDSNDSLDSK